MNRTNGVNETSGAEPDVSWGVPIHTQPLHDNQVESYRSRGTFEEPEEETHHKKYESADDKADDTVIG